MYIRGNFLRCVHICMRTQTRQPRWGIRKHMPWLQHEAKCCRSPSQWMFSLKYQLQADNVHSASDQTETVFLSLVTRLYCYACLASTCLVHVFVLMWMRLCNFSVPTSFCALSTGLELPYLHVFVFGWEMVLSTHPKCADCSFESTLVSMKLNEGYELDCRYDCKCEYEFVCKFDS